MVSGRSGDPKPFSVYIDGGVYIPIVVCAAVRAGPLANIKILYSRVLLTADGAQLARREESPDLAEHLAFASALVLKLPSKLAHRCIGK